MGIVGNDKFTRLKIWNGPEGLLLKDLSTRIYDVLFRYSSWKMDCMGHRADNKGYKIDYRNVYSVE